MMMVHKIYKYRYIGLHTSKNII